MGRLSTIQRFNGSMVQWFTSPKVRMLNALLSLPVLVAVATAAGE